MADFSQSKLGSHVVIVEGKLPPELMWMPHESGRRLITVPDDDSYLIDYFANDLQTVVVRATSRFPAGSNFNRLFTDLGTDDPVLLAYRWWNTMRETIQAHPQSSVYWQAVNEPDPYNFDMIKKLNLFEKERMSIADQEGFKCGVFTFSVGTPDPATWLHLRPALEAAHKGRHVVCLNEYFPYLPWIWYGPNQTDTISRNAVQHYPATKHDGWLMFRYRKLWKYLESQGFTDVRIVLTETGSDRAAYGDPTVKDYLGADPGPWMLGAPVWQRTGVWKGSSEDTYLDMLQWVDSQMRRDPYLLGAGVFLHASAHAAWFNRHWGEYILGESLVEKLYTYIGSQA